MKNENSFTQYDSLFFNDNIINYNNCRFRNECIRKFKMKFNSTSHEGEEVNPQNEQVFYI